MVLRECWELMGNCLPIFGPSRRRSDDDAHNLNSNAQPVAVDRPNYAMRPREILASTAAYDNGTMQQRSAAFERPQRSTPNTAIDDNAERLRQNHRRALIQRLRTGVYEEGCKAERECIICMDEFEIGDELRYLPCLHSYHAQCIDDWLTRKFQCPACMEPVESGLFAAFSTAHEAPVTALSSLPSTSAPRAVKATELPGAPPKDAPALPSKNPLE